MRRLLVLLLLPLGLVAFSPSAAQACTIQAKPLPKQLASARAVFTGSVTDVTANPSDAGATTLYRVTVDRTFKGKRVAEQVLVSSPTKRARCGLVGIKKGERYLFVTGKAAKGVYPARSHQGTQAISQDVRAVVVSQLGEGTPPGGDQAADTPDEVTTKLVDDSVAPNMVRSVGPGVLLVLVGALLLVLLRLFGRRRA